MATDVSIELVMKDNSISLPYRYNLDSNCLTVTRLIANWSSYEKFGFASAQNIPFYYIYNDVVKWGMLFISKKIYLEEKLIFAPAVILSKYSESEFNYDYLIEEAKKQIILEGWYDVDSSFRLKYEGWDGYDYCFSCRVFYKQDEGEGQDDEGEIAYIYFDECMEFDYLEVD